MKLYAGTPEQFRADTQMHRIAEKLRAEYVAQIGHKPGPSEVASWQNSLQALALLINQAKLEDHGVILEYQLGNTSKRLDAMLTGRSSTSAENAVVVELKQWGTTAPSPAEGCVETFVGQRIRRVLHPSVQVGGYQQWLLDNHAVFYDTDAVGLTAVSYLHNMQFDPAGELWSERHTESLSANPLFTGDQSDKLAAFLNQHLSAGDGIPVMSRVLESKYRPSRKLLEHTAAMIAAQSDFVLLDEQRVAFESVLAEARAGYHEAKKSVVVIQGGPGTGKSVIALHLVGELAKLGYNAQHATGSKAFTENIRRVVGRRAGNSQFRYFNQFGGMQPNDVDVLILDEAHRLRETSASRFTPRAKRSDLKQVDELIGAAKTSVFFIDDLQGVRPNEVGDTALILEAAERNGAEASVFELETQFRLAGSKAFLNWVDHTLGLDETATPIWEAGKETFDFQIVDSVEQLDAMTRSKADEGQSARLTAGFCWPWSDPEPDGTLVNDVKVGDWQMPWNAKPDAGRLAPGIPPSNFWASNPNGINQVGCVYTAQGFEFDYVGVIFGRDLRWDPASQTWIGDSGASHDSIVKRSGDRFTDLVKRTYRVLLTRGLRGCYVYFEDEPTRQQLAKRTA
ncbi:MAG: DUF2075 domain-containing protein [Actinobacteria bacterium]|nr:DUF2075 domain-containing protein [Actinomycetota bacterium]